MPVKFKRKFKKKKYMKKGKVTKGGAKKPLIVTTNYPILNQSIAREPTILPGIRKTKMVYEEDWVVTASTIAPQYIYFSCNGLHDPNIQIGGHQPYGYDQMSTFYERWDVMSSKIYVQYYQPTVVNNNLAYMRCFVVQGAMTSTLPVDYLTFREAPLGSAVAPIGQWDITGMFEKSHVEESWSRKKYVVARDDLSYGSTYSALSNPANQFYYAIGCAPVDGIDTYPYNWRVRVRIEYNVVMSQPRTLSQS